MKYHLLLVLSLFFSSSLVAETETISVKQLHLDLATELAQVTLKSCRDEGYNVSVVVVDRSAQRQVVLRDNLAAHFTIQIAQEKANAAIMSGTNSGDFRANRADIKDEMNEVDGILLLDGGLLIAAGGSTLGAVGVSGAPGGEKDAACAQKGLDAITEKLEFAAD